MNTIGVLRRGVVTAVIHGEPSPSAFPNIELLIPNVFQKENRYDYGSLWLVWNRIHLIF